MKNILKLALTLIITIVGLGFPVSLIQGQNNQTINDLPLELSPDDTNYSFLLAGHAYGSPNNSQSVYPSASLLANLKDLNGLDPDFVVFLGDMVRQANEQQFNILEKSLVYHFEVPVFNSPGNHDLGNRDLYETRFGKTFQSFRVGNDLFIFMDTGLEGEISQDQKSFLQEQLELIKNSLDLKNVFFLSHRLFWLDRSNKLLSFTPHTNTKTYTREDESLSKLLFDGIRKLKEKNIFMIAGDIGAFGEPSLFYAKDPDNNKVTLIATGLGETQADAIIKVDVDNSKVSFEPISLSGKPLEPLPYYSPSFWRDRLSKPVAEQTLSLSMGQRIKLLLLKKSFWAGAAALLIVQFLTLLLLHKWRASTKT